MRRALLALAVILLAGCSAERLQDEGVDAKGPVAGEATGASAPSAAPQAEPLPPEAAVQAPARMPVVQLQACLELSTSWVVEADRLQRQLPPGYTAVSLFGANFVQHGFNRCGDVVIDGASLGPAGVLMLYATAVDPGSNRLVPVLFEVATDSEPLAQVLAGRGVPGVLVDLAFTDGAVTAVEVSHAGVRWYEVALVVDPGSPSVVPSNGSRAFHFLDPASGQIAFLQEDWRSQRTLDTVPVITAGSAAVLGGGLQPFAVGDHVVSGAVGKLGSDYTWTFGTPWTA